MVGDGCAVVVGDSKPAFDILEFANEGRVKNERLRTDFVAAHAFGEGGDFGGGEGGVPDADFGDKADSKQTNRSTIKSSCDC